MRHLFLLSLLAGTALQAQVLTENYVELTVTDTISMRLKSITYEFTPQSAELSADAVYEENTDWEKVQERVAKEAKQEQEKLMKGLAKEGFKAVAGEGDDSGDYTISSYEEPGEVSSVHVQLASEAELKRLVTYLRANSKGDGHVSKWDYEPSAETEVELMQRLYKKASAQASAMATLGGRKLGKLITAHDPENGIAGHWLEELIGEVARHEMMKKEFGGMQSFLTMGREKTLVFRFGLE